MMFREMIIGIALASGTTGPAIASNCAPRDIVIERLASKYGESRKSVGLGGNNSVVEVFASEVTGTWTITVTSARGVTCLVASGQAFEELNEGLPGHDTDA